LLVWLHHQQIAAGLSGNHGSDVATVLAEVSSRDSDPLRAHCM